MNRPPAFQFYAKDWLSSGKIATMTLEEEGAYIHLLAHCWLSEDCSLPDDDTELAQLSRLGERWFNGASVKLRLCFTPHPRKDGRLFNARLMQEHKKQAAWRKKSQEGGKRSAESRALRSKHPARVVEEGLNGGSREVEPKTNSSSSSSLNSYRDRKRSRSLNELNGHGPSFEVFWAAYPKKEGKGACRRWWKNHKPDDVLLDHMLAKIEQAKLTQKWMEQGGKFIPMPATWLNEERWDDEYHIISGEEEPLPL